MKKIVKKISTLILSLFIGLTAMVSLTGCDETVEYDASCKFYWSADGGATYVDGSKEYEVGENVYMQLKVKVNSTSEKQQKVNVTLTIPYVQDVVSKYYDGQVITPEYDELNHIAVYNFTVIASSTAKEEVLIFKFIPTKATDITLKLTFDDTIDEMFDKQNTITFIDPVVTE